MPLYDYRCNACGTLFEVQQRMHSASPRCPACGATTTKEFHAAPAVHGDMARGRESAVQSLQPLESASTHKHGPDCGCSRH
jgi:putative FmdB family regulatory protein